MAFFGWLFFRHLFRPLIGQELASQYIAGVIILAAAPCTAMVFVWSYLSDGDPAYTLVQVSVNDLIMLALRVPGGEHHHAAGDALGLPNVRVDEALVRRPCTSLIRRRRCPFRRSLRKDDVAGGASGGLSQRLIAVRVRLLGECAHPRPELGD